MFSEYLSQAEHKEAVVITPLPQVVLQEVCDSQVMLSICSAEWAAYTRRQLHTRIMRSDPESPARPEEAQPLRNDWSKSKIVTTRDNLSTGVYYPTVTNRRVEPQHHVSSIVNSKA